VEGSEKHGQLCQRTQGQQVFATHRESKCCGCCATIEEEVRSENALILPQDV
jgi:hypothetical protein